METGQLEPWQAHLKIKPHESLSSHVHYFPTSDIGVQGPYTSLASPDPDTCQDVTGGTGIRLAGATNSVHVMDVRTGVWQKVTPHGEPPSPRAAHAAAAVGTMVVVQVRLSSIAGWHSTWS